MRIRQGEAAIFGSGCNPTGLHHELMARLVFQKTGLPTWIMPCYRHLFSKDSELIESSHRWNMLTLACEDWEIMRAFDWEIAHRHDGSMYSTMQQLVQEYPDVKFHIVIGMDNANIIETKWIHGNLLIQEFPFIVLRRDGCPETADWFNHEPHQVFDFENDASSTDIRTAIREGRNDFAAAHLDSKVWDYIKNGGLYGYHETETG